MANTRKAVAVAFPVLFALVLAWLILVWWYFRRLRRCHPATYEAIGSPSLFWNNSTRNNWLFLKFLFSAEPHSLGDRAIGRASRLMRVLFVAYPFLFLLYVALLVGGW